MAGEGHLPVLQHHAVQDVALADKVRHEGVLRLVIDINGGADLLDAALGHDHHRVRHGQGLLLIVGHEHKGNAGGLLDLLQLLLHILAQLQIQGGQRLVQQQHLGLAHQSPGDGYPLLLPAGKAGDAAVLKAGEGNQGEHIPHLLLDFRFGHLLLPQGEGHVLKHVQMGEQGIALEHGVHVALVGGHIVDVLPHEDNVPLIGALKPADEPQGGCLAAAGGTQQGEKLIVIDVQTDVVQHYLAVKGLGDVFQLDDFFHIFSPRQKIKGKPCVKHSLP